MKKQAFILFELSISMAVFLSTVLCVLHLWSKIEIITKEVETRIRDLHTILNQLERYTDSSDTDRSDTDSSVYLCTEDITIPNQPKHFIIKKIKIRTIELVTGFYG